MIENSLFLGTLWHWMTTLAAAVSRTRFWAGFDRVCRWFGTQTRESVLVTWFCTPRSWRDEPAPQGALRRPAAALYRRLKLDHLMEGSVFLQCFFWCALPAVLAPLLPTIVLLALVLVGFGSTALSLLQSERRLQPSRINFLVFAYAALYLVGTLHSVDRAASLTVGAISIAFILYAAALYHAVHTRAQLDALVAALVAVGTGVSAYGIVQYVFKLGYQSKAWVDSGMFGSTFRVTATLENPNMLGEYLVLILPLAVAELFACRGTLRRCWYLVCCGVMGACMLLTFSRGAWLGLLFAAAVFVLLALPRLLWLAPLALAGLYFVLPASVIARFTSIGNLGDSSTSYRLYILLGTIAMLADGHWMLGIGPGEGAFDAVYPLYSYNAVVAPHSHNLFLQILCDAGIAALVVFVWLLLRHVRSLCRAMYRESDAASRYLQAGFTAGLLGFLLQGMTDYSFYNYHVMLVFWAYLAVGALCARRGSLREGGLLS